MNTKTISAMAVAGALAIATSIGSAATYEENLELAKTPIAQITTANAT